MLRFSLPYLLSCFLQTFYGLADLFITGRYNGADTITAVSVGSQVTHMLTVVIVGLAMGATVTISRAVGARDQRRAEKTIGSTISLFALFAVGTTVLLLLAAEGILSLLSTPAEAFSQARSYLTICFVGIPFITAYNVISSVFRGLGDSKSPMYFVAAAGVINVILDWLFIGPMALGAVGAALATVIAQGCSVVLALLWMRRQNLGITLRKSDLRLSGLSVLLKIGVPVALQDGFIQIAFLVITVIANLRGLNDAAAVGIVEKIIGFLFLVPSSMLSSVSALCAQNIGAGRHDRAKKTLGYAIALCVGFGLIWAGVMLLAAEQFVGLFAQDAEVIRLGGAYMRGYVWDCVLAGIHFCFSGYFCAYGLSGFSFLHNSVSIVCARIPLAYLASKAFPDTLLPMGLATTTGSAVSVIICLAVFAWMQRKRIREEKT